MDIMSLILTVTCRGYMSIGIGYIVICLSGYFDIVRCDLNLVPQYSSIYETYVSLLIQNTSQDPTF